MNVLFQDNMEALVHALLSQYSLLDRCSYYYELACFSFIIEMHAYPLPLEGLHGSCWMCLLNWTANDRPTDKTRHDSPKAHHILPIPGKGLGSIEVDVNLPV
jgi:hypothetical protein